MDGISRRPLVNLALPKLFAGLPIETIDHPMVRIFGWRGPVATEVEPFLGRFDPAIFHHRRDKDFVSPYDRGRPTHAGNICLPGDILIGAPACRQIPVLADTPRLLAAKLRPVLLAEGDSQA